MISFAGAINTNWIEVQEPPIVSVHGNADQTIDFNCAPGLGVPTVLELCGVMKYIIKQIILAY